MTRRSLKTSVTQWMGFPKLHAEFGPYAARDAANRVNRLLGDLTPRRPAPFDLRLLHSRIRGEWQTRHSLSGISPRDMRQLPWILFYPPGNDPASWLGADPRVIEEYRAWLLDGRRTRSALALLHEFLRVYPTDLASFSDLQRLLHDEVARARPTPVPSLSKWKQRCSDYGLIEDDGGGRFASNLLSRTSPPHDIVTDAGLDAGLSRCGFLRSGVRSLLPECSSRLTEGDLSFLRLQRLLELLVCEGRLRFGDRSMRAKVAQALLDPFIGQSPQAETKQALQSFFLLHFGDPRLPSGSHRWGGVPDDTKRVVIKWLVKEGLEQFFRLVKESAYDRHWRYREAFWRAFLDEDLIDDIWFALGPRAKAMLRGIGSEPEVEATTAELRRAQSDQSVLLMRLPGVTIAEWSHSGSCHLWLDGVPGAPVMYKLRYSAYETRRPFPYEHVAGAHSQRHDGSPTGRWQDATARWLRENTGIRLARRRYFPPHLRGFGGGYHRRY